LQRTRVRCTLRGMTQTMNTTYELLQIEDGAGGELGSIALDVEDDLISLTVDDESGTVLLGLSITEAEQLIAKLAVKVAQARMAR